MVSDGLGNAVLVRVMAERQGAWTAGWSSSAGTSTGSSTRSAGGGCSIRTRAATGTATPSTGPDRKGLPCRNLFRHRREYPDPQQYPTVYQGFAGFMGMVNTQTQDVGYGPYPGMLGADPAATAQDDDYELRRSRTPVPGVRRRGRRDPPRQGLRPGGRPRRARPTSTAWWEDVDGRGTPIDDWMRETVAPLLLVLGCLDICLDHPKAPPGASRSTPGPTSCELGLDTLRRVVHPAR